MTEDDRTVQVPDQVSVPRVWLERLMPTLQRHSDAAMIQTADWALSQPTPTAEPDQCATTASHAPHEWAVDEGEVGFGSRCPGIAEPPHIEDMAPGTTFTAASAEDVWRWAVRADGLIVSGRGFAHGSVIAPSTIRDVTPPKGDDRG